MATQLIGIERSMDVVPLIAFCQHEISLLSPCLSLGAINFTLTKKLHTTYTLTHAGSDSTVFFHYHVFSMQ